MEFVRRVFCATDLSEAADEAIRQADELARTYSAELLVYHALPASTTSSPLLPDLDRQSDAELPALQSSALDAMAERVTRLTGRGPDDFTAQVGDGAAYAAIVSRAEAAGADIIVVGEQGSTGVKELSLGGVAEKVVRYAHCPVLVARPGRTTTSRTSGTTTPHTSGTTTPHTIGTAGQTAETIETGKAVKTGKLLVATDFSDPALPAVAAAAEQIRLRGGHVSIVYCLDLPPVSVSTRVGTSGVAEAPQGPDKAELRRVAEERLAAAIARFGLAADAIVTEGAPAEDVPRLAAELSAELVIVATAGRTGLSRVMLGSVAEAVVRGSSCSVLVVRLKSAG